MPKIKEINLLEVKAHFIYQVEVFGHYCIYHVVADNSTDARSKLAKYFKNQGLPTLAVIKIQANLDLVNVVPID